MFRQWAYSFHIWFYIAFIRWDGSSQGIAASGSNAGTSHSIGFLIQASFLMYDHFWGWVRYYHLFFGLANLKPFANETSYCILLILMDELLWLVISWSSRPGSEFSFSIGALAFWSKTNCFSGYFDVQQLMLFVQFATSCPIRLKFNSL